MPSACPALQVSAVLRLHCGFLDRLKRLECNGKIVGCKTCYCESQIHFLRHLCAPLWIQECLFHPSSCQCELMVFSTDVVQFTVTPNGSTLCEVHATCRECVSITPQMKCSTFDAAFAYTSCRSTCTQWRHLLCSFLKSGQKRRISKYKEWRWKRRSELRYLRRRRYVETVILIFCIVA